MPGHTDKEKMKNKTTKKGGKKTPKKNSGKKNTGHKNEKK